jgi:CheY-like chemotaxis protein
VYTHLVPMFVVLLIGRVGLCISPVYYNDAQIAYETVFARLLQVLFLCISFYFLKILELKRRTRYVANVAKKDQARELRILALSARVRAEEVQREASRAAAHQVANIFNMLLSATMQMQQSMTEVQQEKLHSCTAVVVECRKEFIALQKTSLIIDRVSETVAVGVKEQQQDHNNLQLLDDGLASEEASDKGDSGGGGGDGGGGGGGGGNNRVCVIDDNDFCREFIMHKIAKILGEKYQVDGIGTSAQAALEHLLKQGSASAYDLVLVDMSMPMNTDNTKGQHENKRAGLWVVSQFKSVHPSSSTKFLCLSGMGHDPNLIGRCKDAGFIVPYALGKPVEWGIMEKILKKHCC